MKNIQKLFIAATCASSLTLTSCIEETVPTDVVTAENLASSAKASLSLIWAMPAYMNNFGTIDDSQAYDWGYGSLMHMRDVQTADQCVVSSGYNWYSSWSAPRAMGERYTKTYMPWTFYYKAIQTTNNTIDALDGKATGVQKGYLGAAYAFRAMLYLEASQVFQFLPNDIFGADYVTPTTNDGKGNVSINYLTIPIVTNEISEEQAKNNPRVSHADMVAFIESDLKKAEELIVNYSRTAKTLPDLGCVYGLEARLALWNASIMEELGQDASAEWKKAEEAARNAISNSGCRPLTQAEWLNTTSGFNDVSCPAWMWGTNATTDDDVVQTGILNWTSWMSNEAQFGYAAAGPFVMITSDLYDQIGDNDFRKLSYKAPEGSALAGQEPVLDAAWAAELPAYTSFKFRPGGGDVEEYKVGAACGYPVMRVEEMYLIEAEAMAHRDAAAAATALADFVKNYRDPNYKLMASDKESVVEAVFTQKRIELWGEGLIFFDYKRMNRPVDRTSSSNVDATENFKTTTRPAWMTWVIPAVEANNNKAVTGYNNPDPSEMYTPVKK